MIDRRFKCDLCRDQANPKKLVGLHWTPQGWEEKPPLECEHHLCKKCLASIAAMGVSRQQEEEGELARHV